MQYSVVNVQRNDRDKIIGYYICPVENGRINYGCTKYFDHDFILKELKARRIDITNLEYRRNTNSLHSRENFEVDSRLDREYFYSSMLENANSCFNNFLLQKVSLNKLLELINRSEKNRKVLDRDLLFGNEILDILDDFFTYLHPIKYRERQSVKPLTVLTDNLKKKDDKTLLFKGSTNRNLNSDIRVYQSISSNYRNGNGRVLTDKGNTNPEVYKEFLTILTNMWHKNTILPNKAKLKSVINVLKKFFNNIETTSIGKALHYEYIKSVLNSVLYIRNNDYNSRYCSLNISEEDRYNILLSRVVNNSIAPIKKNKEGLGEGAFRSKRTLKNYNNLEHDKFMKRVNGEINPIDREVMDALNGISNLSLNELEQKSSQYKLDKYIDLYYVQVKNLYEAVHRKIKVEDNIAKKSIEKGQIYEERKRYEFDKLKSLVKEGTIGKYINVDIKEIGGDVAGELVEDLGSTIFSEKIPEYIKEKKLDFSGLTPKFDLKDFSVDKIFDIYIKEVVPYVLKRTRNLNRGYQKNSIVDRFTALNKTDRDIITYYVCLMLYTRQIQTKSGLRKVEDDLKPLLSYCITKDINEQGYSIYRFRKSEAAWLITYMLMSDKLSGIGKNHNSYHTVYYRLFKYVYNKINTTDYVENNLDINKLKVDFNWHIFDENTFPINVVNLF